MPILDLQRQFRELGRLRLGQQVEFTKNGRTMKRPEKLKTWRLTSPRADLLEHAATVYGGTVEPWPEGHDGDAFQIVTKTDELDIVVPPGRPLDQWNELWGGGGCVRRCDGREEKLLSEPCICKRDYPELAARTEAAGKGEACKPTTRLQVILPRLPDIGTWLLVSHSYYAAVELAGTVELLMRAREAGRLIEARLWIDQRTVKRQGQPTRQFPVPAIRIPETFQQLMAPSSEMPQIAASNRPALPPGPPLPADPSFDDTDSIPDPVSLGAVELIGAAARGRGESRDMALHDDGERTYLGFTLDLGDSQLIDQVIATGDLARSLDRLGGFHGERVTVWGERFDVPWRDADKRLRTPYKRVVLERIEGDGWACPEVIEAKSVPMFDEDDEAAIDAALARAGV